ncbi:hypothetical protein [Legionella maioricensis]|uniref:Uncharacterized protein n=1 Tax=Legionella maioricensis TaxID=2896528 RepID=A0A9X2ICX9_9GAMM|nr:hypothetical protein [Legionella maioricensis]MCL9684203.1 hypothetical protein [Legionella maioricensis]MCL9687069.1 hypothetical protein [Legionella maioricensis]
MSGNDAEKIKKTEFIDDLIKKLAAEKIQKIRDETNKRVLERIKFDDTLSKFE